MKAAPFTLSPWAEEVSVVSKLDEQAELAARGDFF
jgi:hypothetical protein